MKKLLIITLFTFVLSPLCSGQTTNFGLGISPFGGSWVKFRDTNDETYMKLNYNSYLNAHAYYERQLNGFNIMLEASYAKASLQDIKTYEKYTLTEQARNEINIVSAHFYAGETYNKKGRIQFPFYLGLGFDNVSGDPINKFFFSLSCKFRVKFYFTNKIALYGGGTYDTGLSTKSNGEGKEPDGIGFNAYHLDTGIIFNF